MGPGGRAEQGSTAVAKSAESVNRAETLRDGVVSS